MRKPQYTFQPLCQKLHERRIGPSLLVSNGDKRLKLLHWRAYGYRHLMSFDPGKLEPNPLLWHYVYRCIPPLFQFSWDIILHKLKFKWTFQPLISYLFFLNIIIWTKGETPHTVLTSWLCKSNLVAHSSQCLPEPWSQTNQT